MDSNESTIEVFKYRFYLETYLRHRGGRWQVSDSMADTVNEDDVILVYCSCTKPDGAFLMRGALRIKRVQRMAGGAMSLVSDNRKYELKLITSEML